jgi:hypothetical protein
MTMPTSFSIIFLVIWLITAAAGLAILLHYRRFRDKERRLPKATEWDDLDARVLKRQTELAEAEKELGQARETLARAAQAAAEEKQTRQWMADTRDDLLKMEAEKKQLETIRNDLNATALKQAEKVKELQNLQTAFTDVSHRHQVMLAEVAKMETSRDAALKKIEELTKEQDRLGKAVKEFQEGSEQAEKAFKIASQKLDERAKELAATTKAVEAAAKTLAEHKAEIDSLLAKKSAYEKMIESLESLARRLEKQLEKHGGAPMEERLRDLWQPMFQQGYPSRNGTWRETDALEHLSQHLRRAELSFSDRVLRAYHTALKVHMSSPLVVLAGISGTGKSLLPRQYADALGIHFVGLPVAPRWDSPQDLFGFYNYLEGRYRATELARAMVQFEQFNRSAWPLPESYQHGLEDRMLMVLLDEMNLARVEYYFSDFLSRLETRRDININDPKDRQKAELTIDAGSLGKNERALRIFPGTNTLFTGTMNEDESTQSLSDKVLDRACVLRFGSPNRLAGLKKAAPTSVPSQAGLTTTQWRSWQQADISSGAANQIDTLIGELNNVMKELGRPFGHRVSMAMRAYVANYPQWRLPPGTDAAKMALADQVEQRIMPKLRGLDIAESQNQITKIERIVDQLGDPDLVRAIQQGRQNQQSFIWRGIDRG